VLNWQISLDKYINVSVASMVILLASTIYCHLRRQVSLRLLPLVCSALKGSTTSMLWLRTRKGFFQNHGMFFTILKRQKCIESEGTEERPQLWGASGLGNSLAFTRLSLPSHLTLQLIYPHQSYPLPLRINHTLNPMLVTFVNMGICPPW
jgi:hypothetical protein